MKKTSIITLITGALLLFASCKKDLSSSCVDKGDFISCQEDEYLWVRFANKDSSTVNNVTIGSVSFENVAGGQTTEYKRINSGKYEVIGTTGNGEPPFKGSGKIKGSGHCSVILSPDGRLTVSYDSSSEFLSISIMQNVVHI